MTESPQDSDGGQTPAAPAPLPRRRGSRLISLAWGGAVVLLLAGVAWLVHSRTPPDPRAGSGTASVSVVTAPVVQGDLPVTLNALGTVSPLATVTVKTQIAGRLVAIGFQEGQIVRAGDFLAQVDPRPYQIALDQAQGQLVRDTALLHNAQIDLTRYRTLAEQDSIPQQQADTQAYLVHQYEGTVKSDQAMVDNSRLNLEYCHIVAPVSGRVGLRQVDQGNYVQTSDPGGIVVITQLQPISVIFTLPEDNVPTVMSRLDATATLAVTALLLVETMKGATLVPSAAVQRGAPGTFVYVVDGERVVHLQPVKLGPTDGERVAILSGASVGAQVVVDGADKLRDGAKVNLAG